MTAREMLERMARSFHDETDDKWFCLKKRAEMEGIQAALHELANTKRQPHMDRMILATAIGLAVLDITELEL